MEYTIVRDEDYLEHHGIKGQKWGVRRYQNEDGSLTEEGRKRYGSDEASSNSGRWKKVATGAAAVAAVGAAAYLAKKSDAKFYLEYGAFEAKNWLNSSNVKPVLDKAVKSLGESAEKVGKAMTDAMIASMGAIAVSKLNEKLSTGDNVSEAEKNRNKILLDTATAGINAATNANANTNKNNPNGNANETLIKARNLKATLGTPAGFAPGDDTRYSQIFQKNQNLDQEVKSMIKAMRKENYSVDQIEKWINSQGITLQHGLVFRITRTVGNDADTFIL